jgi:hypothetical protein
MLRFADHPSSAWLLGLVAFGIAAVGAKPYAGSWNDGSRLAVVESLLDRGTLSIDDSVFCKPPPRLIEAGIPPYDPERPGLLALGTFDKLFVHGHYYSDKPAVVSYLMAAMYQPLMWLGIPSPGARPDVFCYLMTLLTSGLGYAVAVGCLWTLGRRVGLDPGWRLIWLAAFALSTYAPTYTQQVNNGAMQLGVVGAICMLMMRNRPWTFPSLLGLGLLVGLGFNLDFGSGPPLVALILALVVRQTRSIRLTLGFALGVVPWIAAGIGINYAIGGVWKPINMYPEHFQFPGSPFTEDNLTGFFRHEPLDQFLYAAGMLLGKKGFWNHNLPLLLLGVTGWSIFKKQFAGRKELATMLGWCAATWLMYAVLSNNMGGECCSVRWFVPFLAPGFWWLAIVLRDRPDRRAEFASLAVWGLLLSALMWWKGPWTTRMTPLLWPVTGAALTSWGVVRWQSRRSRDDLVIIPGPGQFAASRAA